VSLRKEERDRERGMTDNGRKKFKKMEKRKKECNKMWEKSDLVKVSKTEGRY